MTIDSDHQEGLREAVWSTRPWGDVLHLERAQAFVVPTRGRTGRVVVDEVQLEVGGRRFQAVTAYASRLNPALLPPFLERFSRILRESLANRFESPAEVRRLVVVERASPSLLDACRRERVGVLDLTGTVSLDFPEVVIRVKGERRVQRRLRVSPYSGLGVRVIRSLLTTLAEPPTLNELRSQLHASYSSVWSVIAGLERDGLVTRRRAGPLWVVDPRALLSQWRERGLAPIREGFYCPKTSAQALLAGLATLRASRADAVFTYRSALADGEVTVAGLPHGLWSTASTDLIVRAFELRPTGPTNFYVLREPVEQRGFDATVATRTLGALPIVSAPQLVVDLHHAGDRAREQAAAVADTWWKALPPRPLND